MSAITTHVLDTARGCPAAGIAITLERCEPGAAVLGRGETDADGRLRTLLAADAVLEPGDYRLTFETGAYLARSGGSGFYPRVTVEFTIRDVAQHYHVPLLLSPFGYATYRGS
jgi:5-hydroxyisourate hydrolase